MELKSEKLKAFVEEIQTKNRNPRDNTAVLALLKDKSSNPELILSPRDELYRSRLLDERQAISNDANFKGFNAKDSFVPPADKTLDCRANYKYIPYLYCANEPYTSVVEVRPRVGAKISVATIRIKEDLKLLDFTMRHGCPATLSEEKESLFEDLSELYSAPVTREDDTLTYIPTQYIAEYVKQLGYDGIAYKSALTPEVAAYRSISANLKDRYNVVVFNYEKCEAVNSRVVEVKYIHVECSQEESENKLNFGGALSGILAII